MQGCDWRVRVARAVGGLLVAAALSGCGGIDGVELNGGVFDALGVSPNSQGPKGEPKMANRPGIVLPPNLERLPSPETATADSGQQAWPKDPDQQKKLAAANLDKQHEAFCRDALWRAKTRGEDETDIRGPKGPCSPSIVRSLTGKEVLPAGM